VNFPLFRPVKLLEKQSYMAWLSGLSQKASKEELWERSQARTAWSLRRGVVGATRMPATLK
jgi:hypothetical protein